jgi:hypothetical protein
MTQLPSPQEMPALEAAHFLRRIRLTHSVPALTTLAGEISERFPDDDFTSRLLGVIGVKTARLSSAN